MMKFAAYKPLTADEEYALLCRAQEGDRAARDTLVLSNMRFVVAAARPFRAHGLDDDELLQEGVLGFLNAIDHFDLSRGTRLTTCAAFWIRNQLHAAINGSGAAPRLSDGKSRTLVKLRKALAADTASHAACADGRIERAARLAGCTAAEGRELLSLAEAPASLDAPASTDGDGATLGALLADTAAPGQEAACIRRDEDARLRRAVASLPPLERAIVRRHYGLDGAPAEPFSQIAARMGRTKSRMHQLEKRALATLRAQLA